ncbi:hypothetical protein MCHIJ_23000 [Mycolicibacterium chitae]|uniref:PASTA domain-containing protein n=1 Tax=Mycolicibacterium chitae TaxID=1792 RepID=A0A3S4SXG8_MYCCI|nr:hypothetical protein [Mycolicibacterium chitae]BBZ02863.1 hypothetical protein MCHIJ_23000 [Mycolicibacterium chitae]VEG45835.1 Uncharacterised protein [Mycolicibacterium chitae]
MIRSVFVAAGLAVVVSACGGGGESAAPSTVTVRETVTSVPVVPAAPAAPAPAQSWTMPDLRGKNLQDAQDAIQLLTNNQVFFSGSTDLTGQGRNQIMDRNWQVCTSTPAPGASFTAETSIDFGVVRIDTESCP